MRCPPRCAVDTASTSLALSSKSPERDDGVIELRPHVAVPADQAWFWTERWQTMERRVDEHVAAGEETVHRNADDFLAHVVSTRREA